MVHGVCWSKLDTGGTGMEAKATALAIVKHQAHLTVSLMLYYRTLII